MQVCRGDCVLDRGGDTGSIMLNDINGSMLRVGCDRMTDMGKVAGFEYVQMSAGSCRSRTQASTWP